MPKYIDKLLADTLMDIARNRSLDSITVMDLVTAAGVNRKTFYNHFDGIVGLLQYIIQEKDEELIADRSNPDRWGQNIRNVMQYMQDNAWFINKIFHSKYLPELQNWLRPKLMDAMRDYVQVAAQLMEQETGKPYPLSDSQMQLMTRVYSPCIYTLIEDWFLNGMKEPIDEYMNVIIRVLTGGVFAAIDYLSTENQNK